MEIVIQQLKREISTLQRKVEKRHLDTSGPDCKHKQIVSLRRIVKEKSEQLLAQTGELCMYETQNRDLKEQLLRLKRDL